MSKFEFTGETLLHKGVTLKHIVALKDFGKVKKGDKGGWIEKESNLSHSGDSWVFHQGKVFGSAFVSESAIVHGYAEVYDHAKLKGSSTASDNAHVYGDAQLFDNAQICGDAWAFGKTKLSGSVVVSGNARLKGDAWLSSK